MLQGMAILLMIYHHFFNDLSVYGESLRFWNGDAVIRFAWFGKICVGIFAFVSGYGMCRALEKGRQERNAGFFNALGRSYLTCVRQILKILVRYWVILIFFMAFFFVLGRKKFDGSEFLLNFLCINPTYNGAFWYVEQYVKMLLLLPLLDGLFWKFDKAKWAFYGILVGACGILCAWALTNDSGKTCLQAFVEWMRVAFLLVFCVGYLLARFHVYEWVCDKLSGMPMVLRVLLGTILLLAVGGTRMVLADSAAYATLDFLFVPVFVLGILLLTERAGWLVALLGKLGAMSVYLWLSHLFIYELTASLVLKFTYSHLSFYLSEVLLCILVGYACLWVDKALVKLFYKLRKNA